MIVPMRGSEKNVAELIKDHIISSYSKILLNMKTKTHSILYCCPDIALLTSFRVKYNMLRCREPIICYYSSMSRLIIAYSLRIIMFNPDR